MPEVTPLRRNVRFQLLWIGSAISELGTQMTWLAYPLLVLVVTGSPGLAGLVGGTRLAATMVCSLPGGVLVDRSDRRRIMIVSEAVRAAGMASVAVAVMGDHVWVTHLVVVAAVNGAAYAVFEPARTTAIRALVPDEHLHTAYSQEQSRSHAAGLVGPPLGGGLFAAGRAVPFLLDAVSYLASLACVLAARVPRRAGPPPAEEPAHRSVRSDIVQAAGWLWRQRFLRALCGLALLANLVVNASMIPVIVLVGDRGGSSSVVGLVLAGIGVGGLAGSLVAGPTAARVPAGPLMLGVCWLFSALIVLIALPFGPYWPGVALSVGMFVAAPLNIVLQVMIAKMVPGDMLGRMSSLLMMGSMGLTPLAPLVGGLLAEYAGPEAALVIIGVALAGCCAVATGSSTLRRTALEPAPATAG